MKNIILNAILLVFFLLGINSAAVNAGEEKPESRVTAQLRDNDYLVKNWQMPVYVGVVKESSALGNIGNPPTSVIEFQKTLRGDEVLGLRRVIWTNNNAAVRYPDCSAIPGEPKRDCKPELDQEYLARAVRGPEVGEQVILITAAPNSWTTSPHPGAIPNVMARIASENALVAYHAYPATAENLKMFLRNAVYEEPYARRFSLQLFWAVMFSGFASLVVAFVAPRVGFCLGILALVSYGFYESGISVNDNIRVDLLLVYPALLVAVAGIVTSGARLVNEKNPPASE